MLPSVPPQAKKRLLLCSFLALALCRNPEDSRVIHVTENIDGEGAPAMKPPTCRGHLGDSVTCPSFTRVQQATVIPQFGRPQPTPSGKEKTEF